MAGLFFQPGYAFLFVIGGMMAVSWLATSWANNATSVSMQYAGLALYTVAEAIFFIPFLFLVQMQFPVENAVWGVSEGTIIIAQAAVITLAIFGGLTFTVLITKTDFSFLRTGLMIVGFGSLGLIVASIIFGFSLGLVFAYVMLVLAAGYILYFTSQVMQHFPIGSHVAAALALFASLTTLFFWVLRILSSSRN